MQSLHFQDRLSLGDQFLAGNGASECIFCVVKAFCRPGDNIITADRTFAVYEWATQSAGYSVRLVPLKNGAFNDLAMLGAMDRSTRIIFLCNPNNPTGSFGDMNTMRRFLEAVAGRQIVVIRFPVGRIPFETARRSKRAASSSRRSE